MFSIKKLQLFRRASLIRSMSPQTCQLCSQARAVKNDPRSQQLTDGLVKELQTHLDCPRSVATTIATSNLKLRQMGVEVVKENILTLLSAGIYNKVSLYNYPEVLTLDPVVLQNRIRILQESQFKAFVRVLYNFNDCRRAQISLLKAYGFVKDDSDVIGSLLSRVGNAHELSLPQLNEKHRLDDVYLTIIKAYLKWKLKESESNLSLIERRHIVDLSIGQLKSNVFFLLNVAGFSSQMVVENFKYIRQMSSGSLFGLMPVFDSKGCNLLEVLREKPQLLTLQYSKSVQILNILEEFNVPFETAMHVPRIFGASPEDLRERLEMICSHKELEMFKFHPRFLVLPLKADYVLKQLELLRKFEHRKVSLSALVDSGSFREATFYSTQIGIDDLLMYLSKSLGHPTADILSRLKRHPYWQTVSLSQVDETLNFLLNKNFSKELIYESLHIVLYPRVRVEMELSCLNRRNFQECRTGPEDVLPGFSRVPPVKKEFVLPLVLYFIEKESKFSGDAVWLDNVFCSKENEADLEDDYQEDAYPDYFKNRLHKVISESKTVNNSETISENNSEQAQFLT